MLDQTKPTSLIDIHGVCRSFPKGSGLGLAIVHRIVNDYSGEIQVSSQQGSGTRVSVRLRARTAAATT